MKTKVLKKISHYNTNMLVIELKIIDHLTNVKKLNHLESYSYPALLGKLYVQKNILKTQLI